MIKRKIKKFWKYLYSYWESFKEDRILRFWIDEKHTNYHYFLYFLYLDKKTKKKDGSDEYIHITVNISIISHVLISFLIFYILYKFDIQFISEEYIKYCEYILYMFLFYAYIFWIVIQMLFGIYNLIKKNDGNLLYLGINKIIYLLTILSNIFFICYILKIDLNLFLQYNILFIIDCAIILIINIYSKLFNYNITIKRLVNFVYYPWIYMIICIILLVYTKNLRLKAIYFISEVMCFLRDEFLDEKLEQKGIKI